MVLFNQIVQIFRRSQLRSIAPPMLAETLPGRTVRSLVAIKRDGARNAAQKHVWRAGIVLLSADGVGANEIMRQR